MIYALIGALLVFAMALALTIGTFRFVAPEREADFDFHNRIRARYKVRIKYKPTGHMRQWPWKVTVTRWGWRLYKAHETAEPYALLKAKDFIERKVTKGFTKTYVVRGDKL